MQMIDLNVLCELVNVTVLCELIFCREAILVVHPFGPNRPFLREDKLWRQNLPERRLGGYKYS